MGLGSFASLLAAQGDALIDPQMAMPVHLPPDTKPNPIATVTFSGSAGPVGAPPTAAELATRIVNEVGGNGVVTLEQAEKALLSSAPGDVRNSQANVDADFKRLSGGSDVLTLGQLTSGMQSYMDAGGFSGKGGGGGMVVNGVVTGATTGTTAGFSQTVTDAVNGKYREDQRDKDLLSLEMVGARGFEPPASSSQS